MTPQMKKILALRNVQNAAQVAAEADRVKARAEYVASPEYQTKQANLQALGKTKAARKRAFKAECLAAFNGTNQDMFNLFDKYL